MERCNIKGIAMIFIVFANLLWPHISYAKVGDVPKHNQKLSFSATSSGNTYSGNSGNNPYESLNSFPKDAVFIVDTGGDLDRYVFKKDVQNGKIKITLPVSRFFGEVDTNGKLKNLQTMINRGIIEKDAKLLINVFDVDDDYQGTEVNPENDLVLFNGKQLKTPLSSGNNIWSTRSYSIPVSDIKFPQKPSGINITSANNKIEILIDRANQADDIWATEIDWVALVINGIHPIVLIHGHGGGPNTWGQFTPFLTTDNAPFYLPSESETESYGCINNNAVHVGEIVEKVKTMYGVEKVNLVTHSRGGADSRIYIRNGNGSNVNSLIQLAAPNHGAGIGGFGTSCSADDLQRGHFRDNVNYQKIHIPVSGMFNDEDKFLPLYNIESSVPTLITIGNSDWVVDTKSATFPWTPTCQNKQDIIDSKCPQLIVKSSSIGGETTWPESTSVNRLAAGLDHGGIHDDQPTYNWVIDQIGNLTAKSASTKIKSHHIKQTINTNIDDMETSLILSENHVITSGNNRTHTIKVGNTTKVYFQITFPSSTQLNSTLLDSNGNSHSSLGEHQTGFGIIRRYAIETPVSGDWDLQIQSVTSDSYLLEVWQIKGSIKFGAGSEKPIYNLSDTITFLAYLKDGVNTVSNITITAKITSINGNVSQIILYDDGTHGDQVPNDGVYTNTFSPPLIGVYSYSISAIGNNIQRQISGKFSVINNDSVFTDNYSESLNDSDNDGFSDTLTINTEVEFKKAGDYEIIGSLKDANNNLIQTVLVSVNLINIGKQNISLNFDGRLIHNNGVDGLLRLTDLMLRFKTGSQFDLIDYRELAYETAIYPSDDFEQPLVVLTGNNGDQGVDNNSDSLFDLLRVTFELEIRKPGTYQIIARLVASNDQEIEWVNRTIPLIQGLNLISLDFSGQKIRQLQVDGSYAVKDLLIIGQATGNGTSLSSIDAYTTKAYNYVEFQSIPTDLEINSANIAFSNDAPRIGENVQFTAIIDNKGGATSEPIIVQFYEGDPLGSGVQIGSNHTITGLAENTTATILQNWSSTTAGDKDIYVTVNQSRSIAEFDYSNNSAFRVITVSNIILPPNPANPLNPIPTLNQWGMFILTMMLAFFGIYSRKRSIKP